MNLPEVTLTHLDNLWLQVSGTLCNIACTHCFNNSGPNVRTFEFLSLERVPLAKALSGDAAWLPDAKSLAALWLARGVLEG